ncbi:hypothetical protein KA005_44960, partial [bacterium]|nr:hypothetical protein [bacterium]
FPPFDTIVCDPLLKKYFFKYKTESPAKEIAIGSYGVIVEKFMPKKSALFLQDRNIVAVYHKGKLVFDKIKVKKLTTVFTGILKGNIK